MHLLKYFSYRQHIIGLCCFTQSDNFGLLIGVFRPFSFNVITDMDKFKSIIIAICFSLVSFVLCVPFSLFPLSFGLKYFNQLID